MIETVAEARADVREKLERAGVNVALAAAGLSVEEFLDAAALLRATFASGFSANALAAAIRGVARPAGTPERRDVIAPPDGPAEGRWVRVDAAVDLSAPGNRHARRRAAALARRASR